LIVTKGAQGVDYQGKNYPAVGVSVFDVCGAGDTFLSALVYFYLRYGKIDTAIPYANKAAAIAVTHFGTYVLQKRDIHEICD
jgi:D-beta-D-heptose 7-phosphate kinase/D-beta-D-heptose 1-phosphate adenosyltransferase